MYPIDTFQGFTDCQPRPDTLGRMAALIAGDESLQVSTLGYRRATEAGDTRLARQLKGGVMCFAVAVRFAGGKSDTHIASYTGLTLVDIDGIAPDRLTAVLAAVKSDPHTLMAYTTLSGHGVRVVAGYEASPNPSQGGVTATESTEKVAAISGSPSYKEAFRLSLIHI